MKLINKHEVAEMLHTSTRTVFNLRKKKIISGFRIANKVMYSLEEVKQLIINSKTN